MDLLRIARNPNNLIFALCISIIAHFALLYALGVLPFSRKPIQEESILVDFTLMDGKQGAGGKRQESGVRGRGSGGRSQKSEDRGKRGSGEGKEGQGTWVRKQEVGNRDEDIQQINKPAISKNTDSGSIARVTQDKVQPSSIDLVSLNPVAGQRGRGNEADSSSQKGGGENFSGTSRKVEAVITNQPN